MEINSLKSLEEFISEKDNAKSFVYLSPIPEICKTEKCILGVDEAGRGPVLGPMVYGIAFCPISKKDILKDLGCADSKQLTEEKREEILIKMNNKEYAKSNLGWAIDVISPNYLSMSMLKRSKHSLNECSMDSAIGLIRKALEAEVNVAEIYVDTVGPPEKYQAKLKDLFPDIKITVAKKADSTYPIVSAASICAKVSRDHALKIWNFRENIEIPSDGFGSGYPGDPVTKRFLESFEPVFGFPRIVRFAWSTSGKALEKVAFDMEFEEEEDEEKPKKQPVKSKKMTSFFQAEVPAKKKAERHTFFKERCLEDTIEF